MAHDRDSTGDDCLPTTFMSINGQEHLQNAGASVVQTKLNA